MVRAVVGPNQVEAWGAGAQTGRIRAANIRDVNPSAAFGWCRGGELMAGS